ncbi:Predicted ester cyclase [Solimonas aquatica]|uniref:Predicted ester cyclase n=1 Tax=Solimonas aquatica TaxID=489703 RepID=A0A1H9ER09_9GAMM|nr:ester cyclase [Solimonas aquatica]SEQ27438.1 Predicted ester cyclase [Solimonas aquatica]
MQRSGIRDSEVWSQGDAEAAERYIAPKYKIFHDPGDPWEGRELDLTAYKARVRTLRAAFPDQHFDIQRLFADGDAVVVTWLWSATHQGELPGFAATQKRIFMSGATAYFFEGDRLAGHWQITDRLGVYQQLQAAKSAA